jgi:uncharacterized protein
LYSVAYDKESNFYVAHWQNGERGLQFKVNSASVCNAEVYLTRHLLKRIQKIFLRFDRRMKMRRTDRQITDPGQMEDILKCAECCRLGLVENGLAYIVPMSFGVAREGRTLCLYFHSAPKGRKIELIERTGVASFEADTRYQIQEGPQACDFSCFYQSVIGHGRISVLRDSADKLRALRCVMEHYTGKADWDMRPESLSAVVCIRLEIEEMTAKAHTPSVE